jgi:hypothetical protein
VGGAGNAGAAAGAAEDWADADWADANWADADWRLLLVEAAEEEAEELEDVLAVDDEAARALRVALKDAA